MYIIVGLSALFVSTNWAMREPQHVERATESAPRFFVYVVITSTIWPAGVFGEQLQIRAFMKDFKIPVTEVGKGGFQVSVDQNIYSVDAVTATSYKYTDKFYVHQQTVGEKTINVVLEAKESNASVSSETAKQFCNDLIDQQVRFITNEKFGHIRDLIVEEAFKPVNK